MCVCVMNSILRDVVVLRVWCRMWCCVCDEYYVECDKRVVFYEMLCMCRVQLSCAGTVVNGVW